jgi:DtxR family Mn-dependent transcriptional regulator
MYSHTEENYLKAIYQLGAAEKGKVVTATDLANWLALKPPTVLEKLQTLTARKLITYNRKEGAGLTRTGYDIAINVVRRHRIWETYLYRQLKFSWSEVHEIAEQLEHVCSDKLIDKIYAILNYPEFDPHGDPIPNQQGILPVSVRRPLSKSVKGCKCIVLGVSEYSEAFLNYLTDLKIALNDKLMVEEIISYDETIKVSNKHKEIVLISAKAAGQLQVSCIKPNCGCKNK